MAIYRKAITSRNTQVDALAALFNGGTLEWRTGAIPATPETADSGTLLATNTCANPAFAASANGQATYNADTPNTQVATGNIGHMRAKDSGGTVIADFDVTTTGGGGSVEVDKLAVAANEKVTITSFTLGEAM